jgi:serine/threonine protein kinase
MFLDKIISKNKYSVIKLAKHRTTNKIYAVKILLKHASHFQIQNEINTSMQVNHPHIIKYHLIYETILHVYIIMDYIENGDMHDYIINSHTKKISETESINILYQILNVLNYLHNEKGIIHRDIKPNNFLIVNNPKNKTCLVKLIDFGFSVKKNNIIKNPYQHGTELYFPPEYYQSNIISCNEKIDIWATGLVLLNLITGAHPFTTNFNIKQQILHKQINFTHINNTHLRALCIKMLDRNPQIRISTSLAYKEISYIRSINN